MNPPKIPTENQDSDKSFLIPWGPPPQDSPKNPREIPSEPNEKSLKNPPIISTKDPCKNPQDPSKVDKS